MRADGDIASVMESTINDTNRIPNAVHGRTYTPRTSEYEVGCGRLDFQLQLDDDTRFYTSRQGCAKLSFSAASYFFEDSTPSTIVKFPDGRQSATLFGDPGSSLMGLSTFMELEYKNETCTTAEDAIGSADAPFDGVMALPITTTVKCVLSSGEISVIVSTSVSFAVSTAQHFRDTTATLFSEKNELVDAMAVSVSTAKFNYTSASNGLMLSEMKLGNTSLESLVCCSNLNTDDSSISLVCHYSSTEVVMIRQQPMDPIMAAARAGAPYLPLLGYSKTMTIYHLPIIARNSTQYLSIAEVQAASSRAVQYLASLGQNLYADWDANRLFVLYDTFDHQAGLDIPVWLLVCILCVTVACLCVVGSTYYLLDARYTGSIHKVVSMQMADQTKNYAQAASWSTFDTSDTSMSNQESITTTTDDVLCETCSNDSRTSLTRQRRQ
ncbi:hypothetical protein EDD11_005513 [Mortierella claussenii]|nr:hypothetical protein EDD11_005513 [Mortierella claussenii]